MSFDSDHIDITIEDKQLLARAERITGRSWRVLLREIIRSICGDDPASSFRAEQQRAERERLNLELSSIPVNQTTDAFSGRQHDEILYEEK